MSKSFDPLKSTPPELHRFYISLHTTEQWYAVMRECRVWFGTQWRTQPKIRRRLEHNCDNPVEVWFDVPDLKFGSWIALKLGVGVIDKGHMAWDHYSDLPAPQAYVAPVNN